MLFTQIVQIRSALRRRQCLHHAPALMECAVTCGCCISVLPMLQCFLLHSVCLGGVAPCCCPANGPLLRSWGRGEPREKSGRAWAAGTCSLQAGQPCHCGCAPSWKVRAVELQFPGRSAVKQAARMRSAYVRGALCCPAAAGRAMCSAAAAPGALLSGERLHPASQQRQARPPSYCALVGHRKKRRSDCRRQALSRLLSSTFCGRWNRAERPLELPG